MELPNHARGVVVDGRILGRSLARHLSLRGWTDGVLLERRQLTCARPGMPQVWSVNGARLTT